MDYTKLFVKRLPVFLTVEEKESLLSIFGANKVDCASSDGRMRACTVAHFNNPVDAERALMKLHQLEVLGSRLCVEYVQGKQLKMLDRENARWKCQTLQDQSQDDDNPSCVASEFNLIDSPSQDADGSSDESELCSDGDDHNEPVMALLPKKRPPISFTPLPSKGTKLKTIEADFQKESADTVSPPAPLAENHPTLSEDNSKILQQIQCNRLSVEEHQELTMFRNYNPGPPSSKLYIKNLTKQIHQQNLEDIFGVFATDRSSFCVKLMKSGRMKDQAFISYSTEDEAVWALQETNGYKFNDKPIVVVFSVSGVAKPS